MCTKTSSLRRATISTREIFCHAELPAPPGGKTLNLKKRAHSIQFRELHRKKSEFENFLPLKCH